MGWAEDRTGTLGSWIKSPSRFLPLLPYLSVPDAPAVRLFMQHMPAVGQHEEVLQGGLPGPAEETFIHAGTYSLIHSLLSTYCVPDVVRTLTIQR